jgi:hypothetical protein
MKILLVCFLLTGFWFIDKYKMNHFYAPMGFSNNNSKSDSLYISKDLPLFVADSCIGNLLKAVEKSNITLYNPQISFYGLYFNNREKYRYLEVFVDKWNDTKDTSYVGVLKIRNMLFLCSGDIQHTDLFRKTADKLQVKLKIARTGPKSPYDAVPTEPSLQGTFKTCKGLPLYVEVFTANPISGYKMLIKQ